MLGELQGKLWTGQWVMAGQSHRDHSAHSNTYEHQLTWRTDWFVPWIHQGSTQALRGEWECLFYPVIHFLMIWSKSFSHLCSWPVIWGGKNIAPFSSLFPSVNIYIYIISSLYFTWLTKQFFPTRVQVINTGEKIIFTSFAPLAFCRYLTGDWMDYLSISVNHHLTSTNQIKSRTMLPPVEPVGKSYS